MAPMFLISNPKMVLEACGSGIIGTFPALNARTTEQLDDWMQEITDGLQQLKEENGKKLPHGESILLVIVRTNALQKILR